MIVPAKMMPSVLPVDREERALPNEFTSAYIKSSALLWDAGKFSIYLCI